MTKVKRWQWTVVILMVLVHYMAKFHVEEKEKKMEIETFAKNCNTAKHDKHKLHIKQLREEIEALKARVAIIERRYMRAPTSDERRLGMQGYAGREE